MQIKKLFTNTKFLFLGFILISIIGYFYIKHEQNLIAIEYDIFTKTMIIEDKINNSNTSLKWSYMTLYYDISSIGKKEIKVTNNICKSLNSSNIDNIANFIRIKQGINKKRNKNFEQGIVIIKNGCKQ